MDALSLVLGIAAGGAIGTFAAIFLINKRNDAKANSSVNEATQRAATIIKDATQKADSIIKTKELEAKEKYVVRIVEIENWLSLRIDSELKNKVLMTKLRTLIRNKRKMIC